MLEREQVKTKKEVQRITADIKKLFILYNKEARDAVKVAKKAKKALDTTAKITC